MTYNVALEFEQEQRIAYAQAARDAQIATETDNYYKGEFDGLLGLEAFDPESDAYWEGYQKALRQYYLKLKGITPDREF